MQKLNSQLKNKLLSLDILKAFREALENETYIANSFLMRKDSFIDVFSTRYDISISLGKEIKGLKEIVDNVNNSECEEVVVTAIESTKEITVYSNVDFEIIFGIILW